MDAVVSVTALPVGIDDVVVVPVVIICVVPGLIVFGVSVVAVGGFVGGLIIEFGVVCGGETTGDGVECVDTGDGVEG